MIPRPSALWVSGALAGALVGGALWLPMPTQAQAPSASDPIPRQSIDGGAARSASASYALHATIGQPDAGATTTSASYSVRGGFHVFAASAPPPDPLFANGFEAP